MSARSEAWPHWLCLEVVTRIGMPYLELRVHGVGGTIEHIVAGFRLVP